MIYLYIQIYTETISTLNSITFFKYIKTQMYKSLHPYSQMYMYTHIQPFISGHAYTQNKFKKKKKAFKIIIFFILNTEK